MLVSEISFLHFLFEPLRNAAVFGGSAFALSIAIAPLQFLKVRRQATSIPYGVIFHQQLRKHGLKRLFVGAIPYALISLYISSIFGLSEYVSNEALELLSLKGSLSAVFLKATFAGLVESLVTVRQELREISRNKDELMERSPRVKEIFLPILARNSLAWLGSLLAFHLGAHSNSIFYHMTYSVLLGALIGFLTIPFDFLATRNCGSSRKSIKKLATLTLGGTIRSAQSALFTLTNTMCEVLLYS